MKKIVVTIIAIVILQMMCGCSLKKGAEGTAAGTGDDGLAWEEQYDLGMRYLLDGNYEEAILAFNAAIEIEPKRAELFVGRGDAYVQSGKDRNTLALAQADYEMALNLDDANAEAYLGLAAVYLYQGEYEKALEILRAGLEKTGNNRAIAERLAELESEGPPLSIEIVGWEFYEGGFYYDVGNGEQYQDCAALGFDSGICGQYRYSRDLRELGDDAEFSVQHTGRWFDRDGNEIYNDDGCWAHHNRVDRGWFSAWIRDDMPHGTYTYELIIHIVKDGRIEQEMTASINVTIP